jgi:hypothetical protein
LYLGCFINIRQITAAAEFAPSLKFVDTHANPDTHRDTLAPDIDVYLITYQPQGGAKTDFSRMDLFIEFKFADTSDLFCDSEDPLQAKAGDFCFESDLDHARLVRGQLASYTAAHAGCQFRVHIFCVFVCGKYARFIRWDRDGAIVTRRLDYIKEPRFLSGFLWHYESLNRLQQGYDTSVSRATPADIQQNHLFEGPL